MKIIKQKLNPQEEFIIRTMKTFLSKKQITILNELYEVNHYNTCLNTLFTIDRKTKNQSFESALFFKSSTNKRHSFFIKPGLIFPDDNLFINSKNIIEVNNVRLDSRLRQCLEDSFDDLILGLINSHNTIEHFRRVKLTNEEAKILLFDMMMEACFSREALYRISIDFFTKTKNKELSTVYNLLMCIGKEINSRDYLIKYDYLIKTWKFLEDYFVRTQ
jgi:hypothetical protein